MGLLSKITGIFKSKGKEISPQLLESPMQKIASNRLLDLAQRTYKPYTGQRIAEYPNKSALQSLLSSYVTSETPKLYQVAENELYKTMQNEYNPYTSQYYQAFRDAALMEERDAINRLRRGAQLGGMLYSTPRLNLERGLIADTQSKLSSILASLAENERQRRYSAIPLAMDVGQAIEALPLEKMNAIVSISPILKAIEEEPLRISYENYLAEQNYPYQYQMPLLQTLLSYSPYYMPQYSTQPSTFSQVVDLATSLSKILQRK